MLFLRKVSFSGVSFCGGGSGGGGGNYLEIYPLTQAHGQGAINMLIPIQCGIVLARKFALFPIHATHNFPKFIHRLIRHTCLFDRRCLG